MSYRRMLIKNSRNISLILLLTQEHRKSERAREDQSFVKLHAVQSTLDFEIIKPIRNFLSIELSRLLKEINRKVPIDNHSIDSV